MKTMEGNYDSIQFETRAEIGEVIQALKEWKDVHKNDSKMETIQELIDRLDILTLPTAKAEGFLFLPPLHWQIPYGTAMSYTVSTGYIYTVPACPAVQFSYLYADCSCSPFFKILMPAFVSRS